MKKLIELLNEFEKEKEKSEGLSMYTWEILTGCLIARSNYSDNLLDISEPLIYGKSYGFIKWLVKNNKIDISKLGKKSNMGFGDKYTREESLLMVLSISNKPIKDLISYLE